VSGEAEAQPSSEPGEGAWARRLSSRTGEMTMAAALAAVAAFFAWQSYRLPFGRIGLPGPGFFPFALGLVLALLALAIFARAWAGERGEPVHIGHRNVLIVFAALMGTALAFETLGAYATLGPFMAVLLIAVARSALWQVALGSVLGMVAVWAVFKVLLGVQLPAGPF
jgi:hypothetical protein